MTEPTDEQLPDEQQLDDYLKGDSSVSRQYRQLHSAEVPAELDRLVLRQAQDAVKLRSAAARPAWVRWTAPLAVAASAVLVLSIVIQTGVRDETAVLQAPQPTSQAEQRELAESKAEKPITAEQTAPAASGFVPPAEVAGEAADKSLADYSRRQELAPAAPPPPKLDVPAPPAIHPEPANAAPVAQSVTDEPQPFVESRPPPPPVAAPAPMSTHTTISTRSVSRAAEDAARVLQAAMDEAARKHGAGASEAAREEEYSNAQMASSRQLEAPSPTSPRTYTNPELWLKDIRELRKQNKQQQADQEWRRFRGAFPAYEVAESDIAREAKK
ncbi:MAG: hypothetical protein SXG53_01475 [Pseudomonadota bacterium]|nr:hypothetical protein [Pseudomonadota bacterium]